MIKAGTLDNRAAFFRRAATSDGYGNVLGGFPADPEFTVAAAIVTGTKRNEAVMASRLAGRNVFDVTLRYSEQAAEITTEWMMKDREGRIHNILWVDANRRQGRVWMTTEVGGPA